MAEMPLAAPSASRTPPPAVRARAAIEYAIDGDLRYLSHHDELRMLTRALRRADWPLAFSQGFNPQPGLTLPLPRRVGTASEAQWAIVKLREDRAPRALYEALAKVLPALCGLRRVIASLDGERSHPIGAEYEVQLDEPDRDGIDAAAARLFACEKLEIERTFGPGKPARRVDIRPCLENLEAVGGRLRMRLSQGNGLAARASEIITLLGLPAERYEHRLRRVRVIWDSEPQGSQQWPAGKERDSLG